MKIYLDHYFQSYLSLEVKPLFTGQNNTFGFHQQSNQAPLQNTSFFFFSCYIPEGGVKAIPQTLIEQWRRHHSERTLQTPGRTGLHQHSDHGK